MLHETLTNTSDFAKTSPLTWWRSAPPDALGTHEAKRVRYALRGLRILNEPTWKHAVRGDTAAAIGIAIRIAAKHSSKEAVIDLVMSPVLLAAIDGKASARTFVMHMLKKRAALEETAEALAASWSRICCHTTQAAQSENRRIAPANSATGAPPRVLH